MGDRIWQRLRRDRAGRDTDDADGAGAPASDEIIVDLSLLDGLGEATAPPDDRPPDGENDGDGDGSAREAAYAEWAERMRRKREERQSKIRATEAASASEDVPRGPSEYWTTDALFAESARVQDEDGRRLETRAELLGVLGLGADADDAAVQRRYRQLAKEHHPDRYPDADEAVREEHAEQMHRINNAYRALQAKS